jgi:hypothetical protein
VKISSREGFLYLPPVEREDEKDYDDRGKPEDRARAGTGSIIVSFSRGHSAS